VKSKRRFFIQLSIDFTVSKTNQDFRYYILHIYFKLPISTNKETMQVPMMSQTQWNDKSRKTEIQVGGWGEQR
jgi:hypothetical protein